MASTASTAAAASIRDIVGSPIDTPRGLAILLARSVVARVGFFASVLKPMGGPGEGFISFPFKGYALAFDLPRRSGVEELHARIERIVLDRGGRLCTAKDALMSAAGFAPLFPEMDRFLGGLRRGAPA